MRGGVAVVRTDTVYGLLASISNKAAVEKIYRIKNRERSKQCIILVASGDELSAYGEAVAAHSTNEKLPTSVIVPASDEPDWVLRGGKDVAYRIVRSDMLRQVIEQTGPLVAPSANPEGWPPARTIDEAKNYFSDNIDLYVDGGEVPKAVHPSQIVRLNPDGSTETLR